MGKYSKDIVNFLEHEYCVPDTGALINFSDWQWQANLLRDLFDTKNGDNKRRYTAGVISTPRQQGKSLILQCIGAYMLFAGGQNLNIYSIACDRDQAALVPDRVKKAISHNPRLANIVNTNRTQIQCPTNGNTWTILNSDKASAPGITADVLLWDELAMLPEHKWNLLYLLLPTMSARSEPLMIIASTVGEFEEGPLDDFLKLGRDEEETTTYLYETSDIQSPLTNMEQVERDRKLMPPAVFARHYQNLVIRGAPLLSDEDIEAIIQAPADIADENIGDFIGCDWGLTKDKCAIVNIAATEIQYVWQRSKVFEGSKLNPVDLNEAAEVVEQMYEPGWTQAVLFDKWQAMVTIQRFQQEWGEDVVSGYDFTNSNRKKLFKNIFTVIRENLLVIYSEILKDCWKSSCATCSSNLTCEERNAHDFLRELQGLQCDSDFNVTHGKRGDDITVAAALALFEAVQRCNFSSKASIWLLGA